MSTWLLRVLLVALGTLSSLRAQGQAAPAGSELYEAVLAEAMRAYQEHDWLAACERFERAHALYPNARALRGLGVSAFESGQHVRAVHALEAALAHPEKPLPPDLRELTELLLEKARAKVGSYRIELSPADAQAFVDDAPAPIEPDGRLLLDAGVHTLRVQAPGYAEDERTLDSHGGEQETLRVSLAPLPTPAALAAPTAPVSVLPTVREPAPVAKGAPLAQPRNDRDAERAPRWQRVTLWSAVGVGAAASVSAGVLWWAGRARISDLREHCNDQPTGCAESDARERLHDAHLTRLERGINASLGVAIAGAVTAGAMWTLDRLRPGKRPKQRALALRF